MKSQTLAVGWRIDVGQDAGRKSSKGSLTAIQVRDGQGGGSPGVRTGRRLDLFKSREVYLGSGCQRERIRWLLQLF